VRSRRGLVAGWSRTRLPVRSGERVLDVGCGAFPNDRADVACDRSLDEDRHRTGRRTVVDRPFVIADAERLPFRDGAFDWVVASHIAEHVDDPAAFCAELARVARRGYVETPSPLADVLLHEEYHRWRVGRRGRRLVFHEKGHRARWLARLTDAFYAVFYVGRPTGEKRTLRLPSGRVGRWVDRSMYVVRGSLNRSGVMHTRVRFGPRRPLRWRVRRRSGRVEEGGRDVQDPVRPRVAFVDREPPSGFMAADLELLRMLGDVRRIGYPGWPSPRYLLDCFAVVARVDVVFAFFASEHALLPSLVARGLRRRFVVVVGGYDTANEPTFRYGLVARGAGWLPRAVIRRADVVLPISSSAARELLALVPDAAPRARVAHLAVPSRRWPRVEVERCPDRIVTVGYVDEVSWARKGIDRFVELARADPRRSYVLVGRVREGAAAQLLASAPANLTVTGYLPHEELVRVLWAAGVYVQLSRHEGFGLAVAEAMACGCVPVVSDLPALREVVGGWGVVASDGDARGAVDAAVSTPVDRDAMRDDVLGRFSVDRRRQALERALSDPST